MLEQNKIYDDLYLPNSYFVYSNPEVWDKEDRGLILRDNLIKSINKNIIGNDVSPYNLINQALYESLMGKHKVLLSEMPEILYRQILANGLSLDELKDIYKFIASCVEKLEEPISFREAAYNFMPHIFQSPRDLYLTALLKEALQACTSITGFVGGHHIYPIKSYWVPPPNGINFSEATRIPDRISNETDEDLIEKHALLDSLLEKRPWGAKYIHNPFPYLTDDITRVGDAQISNFIKCFGFYYSKYEKFKKEANSVKAIPSYKSRLINILENPVQSDELGYFEQRESEFKRLLDGGSLDKAKLIGLKQVQSNGDKGQKPLIK